jgi:hypothetical protein
MAIPTYSPTVPTVPAYTLSTQRKGQQQIPPDRGSSILAKMRVPDLC